MSLIQTDFIWIIRSKLYIVVTKFEIRSKFNSKIELKNFDKIDSAYHFKKNLTVLLQLFSLHYYKELKIVLLTLATDLLQIRSLHIKG